MMADSKLSERFQFEQLTLAEVLTSDFLKCDQCQRRFDTPVLLPCLHTVCSLCVSQLLSSQNTNNSHTQNNQTRHRQRNNGEDSHPSHIIKAGSTTKTHKKLDSRQELSPAVQNGDKHSAVDSDLDNGSKGKGNSDDQSGPNEGFSEKETLEAENEDRVKTSKDNGNVTPRDKTETNLSETSMLKDKNDVKIKSSKQNRSQTPIIKKENDEQVKPHKENDSETSRDKTKAEQTLKSAPNSKPKNKLKLNSANENTTVEGKITPRSDSVRSNCDSELESNSNCDSKQMERTESNSIQMEDQNQDKCPSVQNKCDEKPTGQIRTCCPLCMSVIETRQEDLKSVNIFIKNLCQVQSYKEESDRTCEYCRYDGKTTTATTLCLNCHDDMCDACVKAHQRTRVTREHRLAPYEQIQKGLYDHDIRNYQNIICSYHNTMMDLFCLTCTHLVCKECKAEHHEDHKVQPVAKAFSKYKKQLDSFLQGMKKRIPTVSEYSTFLQNHAAQMMKTREEMKTDINKQAEAIHKLIDDYRSSLIHRLSEAFDEDLQQIELKCKDLCTAETSLTKNAEFLCHLLKFGKPEEVLIVHQQITNRLKQLVHMKPDNIEMKLSAVFTPGPVTEDNISLLFGNVNIENVPFNQEGLSQTTLTAASLMPSVVSQPELVLTFDMKGSGDSCDVWPTGLAVTDANIFIVDRDNKTVKIFNKNGQLQSQFSGKGENHFGSPFDITVLRNGNIAVTDYKSENVKIFSSSGEFILAVNGYFRYPRGITTNTRGEIVVVDCHKLRITTHNTDSGECLSTISGTDDVNKHLVDPYYIAITDDDNIVVTDHAAPNIKMFNQKGDCLAQYGTYGINQGQVLQPYGVCVDRHGYIFVADHQNSRIHLLLPDGRFSKFLLTKLDKVKNPVAVAVDGDNHLYVAEALGKVKVWKYM